MGAGLSNCLKQALESAIESDVVNGMEQRENEYIQQKKKEEEERGEMEDGDSKE